MEFVDRIDELAFLEEKILPGFLKKTDYPQIGKDEKEAAVCTEN